MIQKICNTLILLILVCVLGILAVLGIPMLRGNQLLAVQSGSMLPTYPINSVLVAKPATPDEINVGDAIVFRIGAGENVNNVTHRVTQNHPDEQYFITKGDSNPIEDEPVPYGALVAKVEYHIPYVGAMAEVLKSTKGMLIAAGLLIIMILLFLIPELFTKDEEEDRATAPPSPRRSPKAKARTRRNDPEPLPQRLRTSSREQAAVPPPSQIPRQQPEPEEIIANILTKEERRKRLDEQSALLEAALDKQIQEQVSPSISQTGRAPQGTTAPEQPPPPPFESDDPFDNVPPFLPESRRKS